MCARRCLIIFRLVWGPGVLKSGDLAAPDTTGFEHLAQENIFASPGGLPSSTIKTLKYHNFVSVPLELETHLKKRFAALSPD